MAPCSEQHGVASELSGSNQPDLRVIGRHGTKKRHSFVEGRAAAGFSPLSSRGPGPAGLICRKSGGIAIEECVDV